MVPGEVEKAGEEAVSDLSGAVPGEDHELRRGLARFQGGGAGGLVGLLPRVGGGAVAEGAPLPRTAAPAVPGSTARRVPVAGPRGAGAVSAVAPEGAAAARPEGGRGADSRSQQTPSTDRAHTAPPFRSRVRRARSGPALREMRKGEAGFRR
ncbi:hypothetical protein GCM10010249_08330 [Streptomyces roseolilacinus]|uniref:Uncharacterized protein n=1 Tax=Streptomyces roseolilacinus TaxID=66904 RepID=A0A918EI03_9ACTN|nr:hypothetical protein GCM10010249_08330 [Streptomyces roseolilacinus]